MTLVSSTSPAPCRVLFLSALMLALLPVIFAAAEPPAKAPGGGKRKLLLFAKNPANWSIVKTGGKGRVIYNQTTGDFTVFAQGLHPLAPYALIRYADAPPGAEILARGMSDGSGRVELRGRWRNWSKKFWLVSGDDVAGNVGEAGSLRGWRPERYLFEEKPLGVPCDCPEPEEP